MKSIPSLLKSRSVILILLSLILLQAIKATETNYALNKSVTSTCSFYNNNYFTDGDFSDYNDADSKCLPGDIVIDLEQSCSFNRIVLSWNGWHSNDDYLSYITSFEISAGDDPGTLTSLGTFTNSGSTGCSVDVMATARYVMITILSLEQESEDINFYLDEIEIFGETIDITASNLQIAAPAITGLEELFKAKVNDAPNSYIGIINSTGDNGAFCPAIKSHQALWHKSSLFLIGEVNQDVGIYPVMRFDARKTGSALSTRPLFAWSNYGTMLMTMSADGKLGIGTTTPSKKLDVVGDINFSGNLYKDGTLLNLSGSWTTSGTNLYYTKGNVGIGTTTPESKLQIHSSSTLGTMFKPSQASLHLTNGTLSMIADANELYTNEQFILGSSYDHNFYFRNVDENSYEDLMMLSKDGYLGIGTTSPIAPLTIETGSGSKGLFLKLENGASGSFSPMITWDARNGGADYLFLLRQEGNQLNFTRYSDIWSGGLKLLSINANGNIGIGTSAPTEKLTVKGTILATKVQIVSDSEIPASDYVFKDDYKLRTLNEVENFVKENKHLPEVPSAEEFKENGYSVGEMDDLLLRKIEELTLYIIEQQKNINTLKTEVESLKSK